jgi:hypothetical protein
VRRIRSFSAPRVPASPALKPFLARGARSAPPFRPPRVAAIPVFKPDLQLMGRFPFWVRGRHELAPRCAPTHRGADRGRLTGRCATGATS